MKLVRVDWTMTPAEWEELRLVLLGHMHPADSKYIRQLNASGKLVPAEER